MLRLAVARYRLLRTSGQLRPAVPLRRGRDRGWRRKLFVRAEIEIEGKGNFVGAGAELLVPKWFDSVPR